MIYRPPSCRLWYIATIGNDSRLLERDILGERESSTRRDELISWLEEVARQLETGTLMVEGEKLAIPEKMKSWIKTKDKKGRASLKLQLEWETKPPKRTRKKDEKAREVAPSNGQKTEQKPDAKDGPTTRVRDYASQAFVCMGGDCKKRGSKGIRKALKGELRTSGLLGDARIDTADCLGLCKHGPNVVVYPEGTWYLGLKEADVPEIVEQHLKGGTPVERLVADRRPRKAKKAKEK
jgi:(2Fe-2S) ferredoxin